MCRSHAFTESAPRWPAPVVAASEHDDDESGYFGDEDELDDFDCQMMPNGLCMNAGSEWCDWECPMNRAASMRARIVSGKAVLL